MDWDRDKSRNCHKFTSLFRCNSLDLVMIIISLQSIRTIFTFKLSASCRCLALESINLYSITSSDSLKKSKSQKMIVWKNTVDFIKVDVVPTIFVNWIFLRNQHLQDLASPENHFYKLKNQIIVSYSKLIFTRTRKDQRKNFMYIKKTRKIVSLFQKLLLLTPLLTLLNLS